MLGRGTCMQLLLASVLSLVFVSPFSSSREFSGLTLHVHDGKEVELIGTELCSFSTIRVFRNVFCVACVFLKKKKTVCYGKNAIIICIGNQMISSAIWNK